MKFLAFVLLLWPSAALALDAVSQGQPSDPPHSNAPINQAQPQKALPQDCNAFRPQALAPTEANTMLSVHLLKDGTLTNIAVFQSSGNDQLDAAAVACAKVAMEPQTSDGQPVEIDWQAGVRWRSVGPSYIAVPNSFYNCARWYPMTAIRSGETGKVGLVYQIDRAGNVTNLKVLQSSHFSDLDQAALLCISALKFPIATRSGMPVSVDKTSGVYFDLRR